MTRSAIFACFMCFVVGGCLGIFVIVGASRPQKKVLLGWGAYLLARWDAYKRADNARRRAAQRRRMERMAK